MKRIPEFVLLAVTIITLSSCVDKEKHSEISAGTTQAQQSEQGNANPEPKDNDYDYNALIETNKAEYTLKKKSGDSITVLETSYGKVSFPYASDMVQKKTDEINKAREDEIRDEILRNGQLIYNDLISGREIFP